ncbi:endonuclease/exonuclease/phosphatase family protein [Pimelobacter simplex]|uniref:endonuclease/exonuclease/phosphatase family protein n=1 Tax=Nocardioides simplex TaxID=2045 RepID=UPI0021503DC8|nr:endonuclease/exonuclease/phosphatase family protein [Pimelobacter simplex]UUW90954.1 endonuclease/exonuclease/phosphatase family protein [Pimelobacter simplex]UUW94783.1 endonuclease/exonuclease/phosphatase family protein [Pimelobacter simplex]
MNDEGPPKPEPEPDDDAPAPQPEPEPAAEPDPPKPDPPKAVTAPGASPAVQVATVAAAIVVLLVVGIVFVVQGAKDPAKPPAAAGSDQTTVPAPPTSGYEPTRGEPLPPLPSIPASLCPSAPLKRPLTVLSFNIHHGATPDERLDLGAIGREITSWKPDVVLLQEVDDGRSRTGGIRQAEALGKATGLNWVYGGNQGGGGSSAIGNAILSRFPVTTWRNTHLPVAGGRELRGLLHAAINVDGTMISVYSTHFDHGAGTARMAQARASAQIMAADPNPKIFGGDLNAGPGTAPLQVLRAAGLGDVWAVGEGAGNTVPARSPRNRIDYVLHDGWFTPLQSAVLRSAISDHRAVWTRVEFRKELGCFKIGE